MDTAGKTWKGERTMKVRQISALALFSLLGGFLAVLLTLHGLIPYVCTADCQDDPCEQPPCCNGDANGDGSINIGDAIHLLVYLFRNGPPPVAFACCDDLEGRYADLAQRLAGLEETVAGHDQLLSEDLTFGLRAAGSWSVTLPGVGQRILLSFHPDGTFTSVDRADFKVGGGADNPEGFFHTAGRGVWKRTGPDDFIFTTTFFVHRFADGELTAIGRARGAGVLSPDGDQVAGTMKEEYFDPTLDPTCDAVPRTVLGPFEFVGDRMEVCD
jgi:hypothetical protein